MQIVKDMAVRSHLHCLYEVQGSHQDKFGVSEEIVQFLLRWLDTETSFGAFPLSRQFPVFDSTGPKFENFVPAEEATSL